MSTVILRINCICLLLICFNILHAQHEQSHTKIAKTAFGDIILIDNQTVFVPSKKSFEVELQQRFGTINHGLEDLLGLYAPSNTRIGAYYVPLKNLVIGTGLTKEGMQLGLEAKYNFIQQKKSPVAISYFINSSMKLEKEEELHKNSEKLSFFHQLLIARQFTEKISIQTGPSLSHFNKIEKEMGDSNKLNHYAISFIGQYLLNPRFGFMAEFDLPLSRHTTRNPYPNLSLGIEFKKGNYAFQVFVENYYDIDAQHSNAFNHNDFSKGQFLIGFNLARSWHGKSHH